MILQHAARPVRAAATVVQVQRAQLDPKTGGVSTPERGRKRERDETRADGKAGPLTDGPTETGRPPGCTVQTWLAIINIIIIILRLENAQTKLLA